MKKNFLWGTVVFPLLLMVSFTGCPVDKNSGADQVWIKGMTDLSVAMGDHAGEIKYSFSATEPAADSYTLYYVQGERDAADIMAGSSIDITPDLTGTIPGLEGGKTYSVVVVAKKTGLPDSVSKVKQAAACSWIKGITGLSVNTGDYANEIKYSFSATEPPADSYTLYYVKGEEENAANIMNGDSEDITSALTGVISGLAENELYSVVVVAEKTGLPDFVSEVKQAVASSWIEGITDFNVSPGDNDGEINYSFNATNPPADSYTLYYITGEKSITDTRENGQYITVTALTGTITGLIGETYSVVVVAQKALLPDAVSAVKFARAPASLSSYNYPDLKIKRGGINPYGMHLGAVDHRALAYSFSEITGAVAYTLYFVDGTENNAGTIMAAGTAVPVEPKTAGDPGYIGGVNEGWEVTWYTTASTDKQPGTYIDTVSYTIDPDAPVFDIDKTYSVVVVAKKPGSDLVSDVIQIGRVPNNTLTITGTTEFPYLTSADMKKGRSIRIAVVLSGSAGSTGLGLTSAEARIPLAVGYRQPGSNIFVFYGLTEATADGVYDPTKPWTATGVTRPVALSDTERQPPSLTDGSGDGHFRYITRGTFLSMAVPKDVSVTNRLTIDWGTGNNQFMKQ
ncbi:MAG: hypothetical protein LBH43_09640 [Treponema sp.]|nr:hypothetical protein [Treponema sp.]